MSSRSLLISIKPKFADLIFKGTKTVELRRQQPKVDRGDTMVVYVSSPVMKIAGTATIKSVESDTPGAIWRRLHKSLGISKKDFDEYFEGATQAVAIHLENPSVLKEPVTLQSLRTNYSLNPPQSFRYVADIKLSLRRSLDQGEDCFTPRSFSTDRLVPPRR